MNKIINSFLVKHPDISHYCKDSRLNVNIDDNNHTVKELLGLLLLSCDNKENINEINFALHDLNNLLKNDYFSDKYKIYKNYYEDINNLFGERAANINLIKEQIDKYEKLYGFSPTDKFLFIHNRLGLYPLILIEKLMDNEKMKKFIPDEFIRYKWIIENQIYISDKNPDYNFIFSILIDSGSQFKKNITQSDIIDNSMDFTQTMCDWEINKFKAIFSDPKYHDIEGRVYRYKYSNYFKKSSEIAERVIFLTPARWIQTTSAKLKYLIKFRNDIKNSNKLRILKHYPNETIASDDTYVKNNGGLTWFIYDNKWNDKCLVNDVIVDLSKIDLIITNTDYINYILSVEKMISSGQFNPITNIYISSGKTGINTNDTRLQYTGNIKVWTTKNKKTQRNYSFIDISHLESVDKNGFEKWKVLLPETCKSAGKAFSSNMLKAAPYETYTQSFCAFLVDSEEEADSLITYLRTTFVQNLVAIRKIKNHIPDEVLRWIPIVPLNKEWNNKEIFKHLNIKKKYRKLFN